MHGEGAGESGRIRIFRAAGENVSAESAPVTDRHEIQMPFPPPYPDHQSFPDGRSVRVSPISHMVDGSLRRVALLVDCPAKS